MRLKTYTSLLFIFIYKEVSLKMSVLSKFFKWLKGEKPPPTMSQIRSNLRILELRLNRYERELTLKKKRAIKSLRRSIKSGEINIAKEHAREVIVLDRDITSIIQLRTKLGSLRSLIERGAVMQDLAKNIMSLVPVMVRISNTVGDKELAKAFMELARTSEKMSVSEETLLSTVEEVASETDVDEAAEELVVKMAEKEGVEIPIEKVSKSKISPGEVEKILKEIMEEEE